MIEPDAFGSHVGHGSRQVKQMGLFAAVRALRAVEPEVTHGHVARALGNVDQSPVRTSARAEHAQTCSRARAMNSKTVSSVHANARDVLRPHTGSASKVEVAGTYAHCAVRAN